MKCRNHPDREAIGVCMKHESGFCLECCECFNMDECCECLDPKLFCKFRSQCVIWERSKERKRKEVREIGK